MAIDVTSRVCTPARLVWVRLEITLVQKKQMWHWVVDECPFCGEKHKHGGEWIHKKNPLDLCGYRYAHCYSRESGGPARTYYMVPENVQE